MAVKAYSVGCRKKNVPIISGIKTVKRLLPNGNIVTIVTGKTKNCGKVAVIVENVKPKPCRVPKAVRSKSGRCTMPVKKTKSKSKARK